MGDYFTPWRRKIGVFTLALACVLAAGWVRSRQTFDFVNLAHDRSCYRFASRFGMISLIRDSPYDGSSSWASGDLAGVKDWLDDEGKLKLWGNFNVEWRRDFGEIVIGAGTRKLASNERVISCSFPYSYIAIPLTLLSAWLLLSKPRLRNSKTAVEPIPQTVA